MQSNSSFGFKSKIPIFSKHYNFYPNFYDFIAFTLVMTTFALIMVGIGGMHQNLLKLETVPIELSLNNLPKYALYTTLRMLAAIIISLFFTFSVATLAAKNRRAEMIIIPVLDILQSVPVLGFLTFTITTFMSIFPGNQAGVEMAAIFAVFTSQAWNMTFSFYQSLRSVPKNLREVSAQFCQNGWQRFWRLEVPFAIPGLVWNTMMSMSGSWFFIVASEAISVGNTQIYLPGIGSWLSLAVKNQDIAAIGWAIIMMGIVIFLYDQLLFRPIVAWSDRFNMGQTVSQKKPTSWVYNVVNRANALSLFTKPFRVFNIKILSIQLPRFHSNYQQKSKKDIKSKKVIDVLWLILLGLLLGSSLVFLISYLHSSGINMTNVSEVFILGTLTMTRVLVMVFIATLIWVPIGVYVGLRPKLVAIVQPIAQFLAAFPANILFPFAVIAIVAFKLNSNIWLSPLIILGTQWYIFFNVIAGVSVFPNELKEAAAIFNVRSLTWWRKVILPGISPYYITGALTATGGSWNASIVTEVVSWGSTTLEAYGLGSYIANATQAGNMHQVLLGVCVMSIFVIALNQLLWRPLYAYVIRLTV